MQRDFVQQLFALLNHWRDTAGKHSIQSVKLAYSNEVWESSTSQVIHLR